MRQSYTTHVLIQMGCKLTYEVFICVKGGMCCIVPSYGLNNYLKMCCIAPTYGLNNYGLNNDLKKKKFYM